MEELSIDLGAAPRIAVVSMKTVMNSNGYYADTIRKMETFAGELDFSELHIEISASKDGYQIGLKTRLRHAAQSIAWKYPRAVSSLGPAALEELLRIELVTARRMQKVIE